MFTMELALKSTSLLLLATLTAWLLRKKSAALRHLIWSLAFAGLAFLPLLSATLPVWRIPVVEQFSQAELVFRAEAIGRPHQAASLHSPGSTRSRDIDWRLILTLLWAGGTAAGLAGMLIAWWSLEKLRATSSVFSILEQGIPLLETESGSMPMTYGLFRPVIFLPSDAKQWSAERLQIVLQHELAHIARRDGVMHVLARAALCLYWWNPLAWLAWREFLKEQERATDDLVLAGGARSSDYASHLLALARKMQTVTVCSPAVAMATKSQLAGRLEAILDTRRDRSTPRRSAVLAAVTFAVLLIAPLAAMQQADSTKPAVSPLLATADEARDKGKFDVAKIAYDKFLNTNPNGAEAARAYLHRGTVEMALKDYHAAVADFQQAQAADVNSLSEGLMWEAIAEDYLKNTESVNRLFEAALTAADPNAASTATLLLIYSQHLKRQGLTNRAAEMQERASALLKAQPVPPPPTPSPFSAGAVRAGGDVVSPKLLSKVEPGYSLEARFAKYSGTILLKAIIGTDGKTHDIQVVRALGMGLDQKAIEAVSQWTFQPGMKDGQPVNVRASIEVSFRLL